MLQNVTVNVRISQNSTSINWRRGGRIPATPAIQLGMQQIQYYNALTYVKNRG